MVEDGGITGHGTGAAPAPVGGEVRLDLAGAYVTPGLIDSHFHLISRSAAVVDDDLIALGMIEGTVNAAERIAAGVTAVRDCGCRHRGIHPLTRAINAGLLRGPRAYVAGTNPTGPAAPDHWRNVVARDADELRTVIRQQVDDGADWVKLILAHAENPTDWSAVTRYLTDDEITAGVDEAHRLGVKIGCHCEGWDVAAIAVSSGIMCSTTRPWSARPSRRIWPRGARSTSRRSGRSAVTRASTSTPCAKDERTSLLHWQDEHRASVQRAHDAAGVIIAAGSDAEGSLPARDVLVPRDLVLAECGLTPTEVLAAATRNGAALIGHGNDLGVHQAGALSDLVVVSTNPLEDLRAFADPLLVVARGSVVRDSRSSSLVADGLSATARESVMATARWTP